MAGAEDADGLLVARLAVGAGRLSERRDVRSGGAIDQQQQRDGDSMNSPGRGSKTRTPSSAAIAAMKSGRATNPNSRLSRRLWA